MQSPWRSLSGAAVVVSKLLVGLAGQRRIIVILHLRRVPRVRSRRQCPRRVLGDINIRKKKYIILRKCCSSLGIDWGFFLFYVYGDAKEKDGKKYVYKRKENMSRACIMSSKRWLAGRGEDVVLSCLKPLAVEEVVEGRVGLRNDRSKK